MLGQDHDVLSKRVAIHVGDIASVVQHDGCSENQFM